jgi:hypothetical protein
MSTDLDFYMRATSPGAEDVPTAAGDGRSDGGITVADIPIATGITDLQVSGCRRTATNQGCPNDTDFAAGGIHGQTEMLQATNLNFEQYRVGITARSNKTTPGRQTLTPPVLHDGHGYGAADNQYMYRSTNFRVAVISRLDTL